MPDERYVADPAKGSRHNRGAAVDLTLVDARGRELPMPTPYDDFTEKAHRDFATCRRRRIRNREILEKAMVRRGFVPLAHRVVALRRGGMGALPGARYRFRAAGGERASGTTRACSRIEL